MKKLALQLLLQGVGSKLRRYLSQPEVQILLIFFFLFLLWWVCCIAHLIVVAFLGCRTWAQGSMDFSSYSTGGQHCDRQVYLPLDMWYLNSQTRDQTLSPALQDRFLAIRPPEKSLSVCLLGLGLFYVKQRNRYLPLSYNPVRDRVRCLMWGFFFFFY